MPTQAPPAIELTARDQAILAGIACGLTRRQTGRLTGMTERAVQSRHRSIARRLGITTSNQAEIIRTAYQQGLMREIPPSPRTPVFLTDRQRQILGLLGHGLSDTEIGDRLNIAENTVGIHVTRIFAALNAKNRAHAVALDHQHRFRDTTHQWLLLLAQFDQRVTLPSGRSVHAYDGQQTACKNASLEIGDRWPVDTDVTCRRCTAFLALDRADPVAA